MAYELYWISGSPNSWRVILAMEFKGLAYVSHRLDPSKLEHKTPQHLALNPRGKVPVLKDGDFVIYESIAILDYLERKHPEPPLFGRSPQEAGHIWQRIFEVMNYARRSINDGVVRPLIRGLAGEAAEAIKASAVEVHEALSWVEGILADTDYLAGGAISAADVSYMPIVQGLIRAGRRDDVVHLELGFDNFNVRYPNISVWLSRIEALACYDKAYPPHWREVKMASDSPADKKKKSAWHEHPDYLIEIKPCEQRLRILCKEATLADSQRALVVLEQKHSPVYYFPQQDVRMELLSPTEKITFCPFKGEARHWKLVVDGQTVEVAAWSYAEPYDEVKKIKDYIAFYSEVGDIIQNLLQ